MLVNDFNHLEDFFKVNPHLTAITYFQEFKKKNKAIYSNVLWFISYIYDPDSKFKDIPEKNRIDKFKSLLPKDYIGSMEYNSLKDLYLELSESPMQRRMRIWKYKMAEKDDFILDTPYNLENCEILDKAQASTIKDYLAYKQITEELNKEKESKAMGGVETSLSDKGGLL